MATLVLGCQTRGRADLIHRVRDRNGDPHLVEKGEIHNIVPHTADLIRCQIFLSQHLSTEGGLVPDPLVHVLDSQLLGPMIDHIRLTPRNNGHLDSRLSEKSEAMAVFDIEVFGLLTSIIQDDASIGHDPIHVQDEQFDLGEFTLDVKVLPYPDSKTALFRNLPSSPELRRDKQHQSARGLSAFGGRTSLQGWLCDVLDVCFRPTS